MADRVLIPWEQVEKLGGRMDGDPAPWRYCDITEVGCFDCAGAEDCGGDVSGMSSPLVLPESGALVKRVLWRHLRLASLRSMEVPDLQYSDGTNARKSWYMETAEGMSSKWLGHGHITDECEALAAIVADEAGKVTNE